MSAGDPRNLVSQNFKVHAPNPKAPDYFLCGSGGRFGYPNARAIDSPVDCKNCLRKLGGAR